MPYNEDDALTPAGAIRRTWGWVPFGLNAVAASIIIIAAVSFGIAGIVYALIPAGTAIQVKTNQQRYSATVSSMPYQVSLVAEMQQHLTNITGPGGLASTRQAVPASSPEQNTIRASELNEITSLCSESANLVPGTAPGSQEMEAVVTANCTAGTPVSAPPLANPVPAGGQ